MENDYYETPRMIADIMVNALIIRKPKCIGDFAVGNGSLLEAAEKKFPDAIFVGLDIDSSIISKLQKKHLSWSLSVADFMNNKSLFRCKMFSEKVDSVLLNPPFSCRGATRFPIELNGLHFFGSKSLIYTAKALSLINSDNGILVAILPESTLISQKDELLRNYLDSKYGIEIIAKLTSDIFPNCSVRTLIIRFGYGHSFSCEKRAHNCKNFSLDAEIILGRGGLAKHELTYDPNGIPFMHTTNLASGENHLKVKVFKRGVLKGPAVLFPRVGNIKKSHIKLIGQTENYQLSDCIIYIKTTDYQDAKKIKSAVINDFNCFSSIYSGTGAKYTTLSLVQNWIKEHGILA